MKRIGVADRMLEPRFPVLIHGVPQTRSSRALERGRRASSLLRLDVESEHNRHSSRYSRRGALLNL